MAHQTHNLFRLRALRQSNVAMGYYDCDVYIGTYIRCYRL